MRHALQAGALVRKAEHPVDKIFLNRWSPRAMSEEEVTSEELMTLFEAARWAPSSYNNQPWRFVYARRGGPGWDELVGLLVPNNRAWAEKAAALVVIVSHQNFEYNGKPSRTHHFDTGAAWAYLALQGSMKGLVVHGMEGFDYDRARKTLGIPDDYDVEAMAAIGRPGRKEDLPEKAREMEAPNGRKSKAELVFEGRFGGTA
jgi:nitroreductase